MTTRNTIRYEFAPFLFFADTMLLKRNGYSVRLSEQSARVLSEFMQHPGELITRSRLCQVLWPDSAFAESEQGLNNIISKLRTVLRDDPKKPKFIETIPKRGYRFLVGVQIVPCAVNPAENDAAEGYVLEADLAEAVHEMEAQTPRDIEEPQHGPQEERREKIDDPSRHGDRGRVQISSAVSLPEAGGMRRHAAGRRRGRRLTISLLFALAAAMTVTIWRQGHRQQPPTPAEVYLAVAPFDVQGTPPEQEQLAESFRLDLIDGLSALPGIHVRAAHSVAAGKVDSGGRTATQNLDVEAILYTRLIRNGAFCNLRVEMVRNRDSTHLQSWHYSGTVAQLSSIREQMEADVFNYWRGGAAARRGEIGGTADPVAYELYLRARYHTQQRDPNAMLEAQKEYREAINRDPGFAKAYSGLALAMFISSDARADQDQAERLALKAARLAPNLADAHAVLGNLYFLDDWRFKEGVRELRRAIALDPSEPSYRVWLALSVGNLGRFQEALSQIDVAEADDPYWPEIYQNEVVLGMDSHQPARMTAASDMLLRIKPESPSSYDARARVDWVLGRYAKAIADWRQVGVIEEDPARIALEDRGLEALRKSGPRAYARLRLDSLLRNRNSDASTDGFIAAEWYAYAGDREGCLQELTRLVDLRSEDAIDILVNPAYAPLHQDLRFQKLAAKLGLSAAGEEPETRAELNPPAKGGEARTADAPVLSLKTGFSDLPAGTPYP